MTKIVHPLLHKIRSLCNKTYPVIRRKTVKMDVSIEDEKWDAMTHEQKNHELFLRQKALLDQFLEKGAISQEQHDKSLHDLTEKMHESL